MGRVKQNQKPMTPEEKVEYMATYHKAWYIDNRTETLAYSKSWYQKNKKRILKKLELKRKANKK